VSTTWRKRSESEYNLLDEHGNEVALVWHCKTGWKWFAISCSRGTELTRVAAMRAAERAVGVTV
jgi:hypothetical protein